MEAARAKSRIVGVTVYREGARIRRVAEIAKDAENAGAESSAEYPKAVRITGLPLSMVDSSVRVSVEPIEGAGQEPVPIAADIRVTLDVPDSDEELAPPEDKELEAARREVKGLDGRIAQIKRELARVQRLNIAPRPKPAKGEVPAPPPESPTHSRLALLDLRETRERALRDELAQLHEEYREAARRAKLLADRYKRATTARQAHEHELRKAVVVSLAAPISTHGAADPASGTASLAPRARLTLRYMVPGARWAPAYSVRLGQDGKSSFSMRAVVAQQTGEDWSNVVLDLSTADAQSWSELPELSSIRIGRRQPRTRKTGWRPAPTGADQLYSDYDAGFAHGGTPIQLPSSGIDEDSREITTRMKPYTLEGRDTLEYERGEAVVDGAQIGDDENTGEILIGSVSRSTPPAPHAAMPIPQPSMPELAGPAGPPAPSAMAPQAKKRSGLFSFGAGSRERRKDTAEVPAYQMQLAAQASRADGASEMIDGIDFDEIDTFRGGGAPGAASFGGGGASGFATRPEPEPELVAGAELLAYGSLRMPPPDSHQRGALRPAGPTELYLELLLRQRIEVRFDVIAVISSATRRAAAVGQMALPARCQPIRADFYDYLYTADTQVDVPSDGGFHSIPLLNRSADAQTRYVVVPRESTDVFRVADIANPLGSPILDGPIDVYLDQDFLLTSDAAFTPPGGTVLLGLGVEQSIKVSRNTSFREETSGLMRGSLALKHQVRIEVQNHSGRGIDCEVRERIPTVRDDEDDIEVTVESVEPPWQAYQPTLAESPAEAELDGGYTWHVHIDSGDKKSLEANYSVKISSKNELVGGNRREV